MKYSHYNDRFSAQFCFSSTSVLIVRMYHMRLVWCVFVLFFVVVRFLVLCVSVLLFFVVVFRFVFCFCYCCCCCCCFGGFFVCLLVLSGRRHLCRQFTRFVSLNSFSFFLFFFLFLFLFFVLCLDIFNWRLEIDCVKKTKRGNPKPKRANL